MTNIQGNRGWSALTTEKNRLAEDFARRLAAYAAAAGAAAAGILAAAPSAQAGIIYTAADLNFTSGIVFINLNHDQLNDFKIVNEAGHYGLNNLSVTGNRVAGEAVIGGQGLASALAFGAPIGLGDQFQKVRSAALKMVSTFLDSSSSFSFRGPWKNATGEYLGLAFTIDGKLHFGWAEFDVSASKLTGIVDVTLLGYAYDTVANQALRAGQTNSGNVAATPEPATLGLLALGSLGLAFWRKRKKQPVPPGS